MIFLVIYDTKSARLLDIKEYDEQSRSQAMTDLRLKQEELLSELEQVEVSLFEAESREMLEHTHSRYFRSWEELGSSRSGVVRKSA